MNRANASLGTLRDTYANYQKNLELNQAFYAARAARWQGEQAMMGGIVGAGSTVLTSYITAKGMQAGNLGLPPAKNRYPWYNVWSS